MDLEAIWQTHKAFILRVLGGTVVFVALAAGRSSVADGAERLARKSAAVQGNIQDTLGRLKRAEGLEKGRSAALDEVLEPALKKTLMWEPSPDLVLKKGDPAPAVTYSTARRKVTRALERAAEQAANADVPKGTGFGLPEQVEPDQVEEALARADLVQRVLTALLEVGVRRVSSVTPERAEYAPRKGDQRHLRYLPTQITFVGDTGLLLRALTRFQKEGAFLQVLRCTFQREKDRPGSPLEVTVRLQALSVVDQVPSGALEAGSAASRAPAGGRVREFGRVR